MRIKCQITSENLAINSKEAFCRSKTDAVCAAAIYTAAITPFFNRK